MEKHDLDIALQAKKAADATNDIDEKALFKHYEMEKEEQAAEIALKSEKLKAKIYKN